MCCVFIPVVSLAYKMPSLFDSFFHSERTEHYTGWPEK